MKKILLGFLVACVVGTAGAQPSKDLKPGIAGPRSDVPQEEAIRRLYAEFMDAWNRHDVKTMAGMWAPDGDHQEPDGRHAKGRKEVEKLLMEEHEGVFKNSRLALTIDGVWFITSSLALVDGKYELVGVTGAEKKEIPPRKGNLTSILLNEGGRWWVAASRTMIPVPLVWRPQ